MWDVNAYMRFLACILTHPARTYAIVSMTVCMHAIVGHRLHVHERAARRSAFDNITVCVRVLLLCSVQWLLSGITQLSAI